MPFALVALSSHHKPSPPDMTRIVFEHEGATRAELVIDEANSSVAIHTKYGAMVITDRQGLGELGAISKLARDLPRPFYDRNNSHIYAGIEKDLAPFHALERIIKRMDRAATNAKRAAEKNRIAELEQRVRELEGRP
jgi:hypothetical protein